ncbi:MAG TPA: FHA domain-containing protein [Vicinamibacterales bacterium]|nr:FHA domain-containing protein [Vicinamibacterales bacterium]
MTYRFGEFVLDGRTRRLLRAGEERHVSPKAFDLLLTLVENRAQAMSKADLLQKLWPSTYVQETNLAGLVAELRQALDDSAEDPIFIRTLHRFGYWFIGAIDEDAARRGGAPPVKYWLLWATRQVQLRDGDNILGRAPDAEVWIDAPGVSRQHARIRVDGDRATLEDLGSKNGTYLGADAVTAPRLLSDGDQIRLGSVVVTFRIPPAAGSTETVRR